MAFRVAAEAVGRRQYHWSKAFSRVIGGDRRLDRIEDTKGRTDDCSNQFHHQSAKCRSADYSRPSASLRSDQLVRFQEKDWD